MMATPESYEQDNRTQLLRDILRNSSPKALGEGALTFGTGLVSQAGTGLGVGAGMLADVVRGRKPNLDAAVDATQANTERFTYQPRTEGGQELLRGLGTVMEPIDKGMQTVGQKAADVTGSPAVGAAVYTGLNVLDPEMMLPAKGASAALRGASNIAREGAKTAVPMADALRNVPKGQRGAYTLEDLSAVEGDYALQSPTMQAFDRLKKQEQRVPGKQLRRALQREGAKPDELKWSGLDRLLDTDEVLDAAQVRAIAERNVPQFGFETQGGRPPVETVPVVPPEVKPWVNPYEDKPNFQEMLDESPDLQDRFDEVVNERVSEDNDLEYPEIWTVYRGSGRHRETVDTFETARDADEYITQLKDDQLESETDYYLENIEEHFDEDTLAEMSEDQRQRWAEEAARNSIEDSSEYNVDSETDYDSEATNLESIQDYWHEQVMSDPADYGLVDADFVFAPPERVQRIERRRWYQQQGVDPDTMEPNPASSTPQPSWAEYTVGGSRSEGRDVLGGAGKNYGVTLANVLREGRHGRGQSAPEESGIYGSMIDEERMSPALANREAERSAAREKLPDIEKARGAFSDNISSHYGENMLHVRETDRPAPSWGTTQVDAYGRPNPMRLVEEVQSDPFQRGRKIGFLDPEKINDLRTNEAARVESLQREAIASAPMALRDPDFEAVIDRVRDTPATDLTYREKQLRDNLSLIDDQSISVDSRTEAMKQVFSSIYYLTDAPIDERAKEILQRLEGISSLTNSPFDKLIPEGPMQNTEQYTKLGIVDALRRAVQQGQQYVAFTPGDVHAQRYGSESIQWGPGATPNKRRMTSLPYRDTGKGPINERVRALSTAGPADAMPESLLNFDVDAPDAVEKMTEVVQSNLDYGMHEYPDPTVQRKKRAEMLVKTLRENPSGEYTPREFGFADVYDRRVKKALQQVLTESGSKAPIREIEGEFGTPVFERVHEDGSRSFETATSKNEFEALLKGSQQMPDRIIYHPPKQYAVELDPALAQAAKRGFKLPY
jgi:hypothetical protein